MATKTSETKTKKSTKSAVTKVVNETTTKVKNTTKKAEVKTKKTPTAKKNVTPKVKVDNPIIEVKVNTPKVKATLIESTKVTPKQKKSAKAKTETKHTPKILALITKEVNKNVTKVKDEKKLRHHDICTNVLEMYNKTKFPIGVLLYIAVGTSAHKTDLFETKGYSKFNSVRANRIIGYCKSVAKAFGNPSLAWNDKVVHTMSKFDNSFENGKYKLQLLKESLGKMKLGKNFKFADFKTAKELNNFIFKTSKKA